MRGILLAARGTLRSVLLRPDPSGASEEGSSPPQRFLAGLVMYQVSHGATNNYIPTRVDYSILLLPSFQYKS